LTNHTLVLGDGSRTKFAPEDLIKYSISTANVSNG